MSDLIEEYIGFDYYILLNTDYYVLQKNPEIIRVDIFSGNFDKTEYYNHETILKGGIICHNFRIENCIFNDDYIEIHKLDYIGEKIFRYYLFSYHKDSNIFKNCVFKDE